MGNDRKLDSPMGEMEDGVNVVEVLADEYCRILMQIYHDPLRVTQSFSEKGCRGDVKFDSYIIEITGDKDWCHSRSEEELTTTRVGRAIISPQRIKVGRLKSIEILLSDPTLFEQSLMIIHDDLTNYLLSVQNVMRSTWRLCNSDVFDHRIKLNCAAVELFDLRYLAHMYNTKYLGWESIPDSITLGERNDGSPQVKHRSYRKKQITDAMHDDLPVIEWQI